MRLFAAIGLILRTIGRGLGLLASSNGNQRVQQAAAKSRSTFAPAVAGFVKRAPIDRFRLASRLASVALLNVRLGRKPRLANKRPAALPAVPVARLGAKKMRLNANQGTRVLRRAAPALVSANNVVKFPERGLSVAQPRLAKAA